MKRRLSLFLIAMLLLCQTAFAAEDYTMAGKLYKQLWAGSGYSGTLTLQANSPAAATQKPIVAQVDYIYVPSASEHQLDLTLVDGENALSAAHARLSPEALHLQADVVSPDWYAVRRGTDGQTAASQQALLHLSGIPSLSQTALTLLTALQNAQGLDEVLEGYITRTDVWIEQFRQSAILDKLPDGTTTMEVHYTVSPAAIKAQVKQLVIDVLSDEKALALLRTALSDEAARYLDPQLQNWYLQAVDSLPLSGELTIDRVVSLKGATLSLKLSLPLYDAQGGESALSYERILGEGEDLPDNHTLRLTSGLRVTALVFQTYQSMTGVKVLQGTLHSEPAAYAVDDRAQDAFGVRFTLKTQENTAADEQAREVYTYDLSLSLSPETEGAFAPLEAELSTRFVSKELKSAATEMAATLTLESEDTTLQLTLEGKTRQKWEADALPDDAIWTDEMSDADKATLLPGATARALTLLTPYLQFEPAIIDETTPESVPEAMETTK